MNNKILILTFLFLFSTIIVQETWSQIDPLSKKIDLKINNQTVEKTLNTISVKAKIFFSYNSDIIPLDSIVSLTVEKKEVYKILNQLLGNKYLYKSTGQHVIILKKKTNQSPKQEKLKIKGTIIEFGTGIMLANASIYHIDGKEGTLSDEEGNFALSILPKGEITSLAINKSNYNDTIIFIKTAVTQKIEVVLKPELFAIAPIEPKIEHNYKSEGVERSSLVPRFVKNDMRQHAKNISYYKQKLGQISFLPFAGTNYKFSGSIVNNISLNVLAGYSYGTNGVEVGGLLNINRKQLKGVQIAGFGNITGDKTFGVQAAGFFNHSYGKVKGVQLAGFHNLVLDSIDGAQIAGFINVLKGKINGAQISGFANITTDDVNAIQFSGFTNIALKNSKGIQASGFANLAYGNQGWLQASGFTNFVKDSMQGIQTTGFMNITGKSLVGLQAAGFLNIVGKSMKGIQAAGFANIAGKDVKGLQAAGFLNYARKVKGWQIGIVNIADTVSGGTIGIFNFVRKGMHQISVSANETRGIDFQLSLGSYRFYSIFGYSLQDFSNSDFKGLIFGIGTQFLNAKKINLNLNLTVTNIGTTTFWSWNQAQQYKISTDINLRILKHFAIYVAPSFNVLSYGQGQTEFTDYPKKILFPVTFQQTDNNTIYKGWPGASLGMKFRI
jgi:hypothetical protein